MGFGAIITAGEKNALLDDDLVGRVTEVRVEQSLDDPTRFAIRFEEDICAGDFEVMYAEELQPGGMIAIAVKAGDKIKCLVRGRITEVNSSSLLGGPGSWYEIRGEDRRVELDRQSFQRRWSGRASDAAKSLLSPLFETRIQQTALIYGSPKSEARDVLENLNQRATDSCFISSIARENNLHFWLEYDCRVAGDLLVIKEIANLKASPPRPDNATPESQAGAAQLVPTSTIKLKVNVAKNNCPNVTAFTLKIDSERPRRFKGISLDDRAVRAHPTEVRDPQPPINKDAQQVFGSAEIEESRNILIAAGSPEELQVKAAASLTDAGWFLTATASTTAHRLNGVVCPHDVIEVEGLGGRHSGPYQIRSVTHVINAADHFMDIELRRNALGKK